MNKYLEFLFQIRARRIRNENGQLKFLVLLNNIYFLDKDLTDKEYDY